MSNADLQRKQLAISLCREVYVDQFLQDELRIIISECPSGREIDGHFQYQDDTICPDGRWRSRIEGNIGNYYHFIGNIWKTGVADKSIISRCFADNIAWFYDGTLQFHKQDYGLPELIDDPSFGNH